MAIFHIETIDGKKFRMDKDCPEEGFEACGLDFKKEAMHFANDRHTAWEVAENPELNIERLCKEFVQAVMDGKCADFKPVGGDWNARAYLALREVFPDIRVDEEETGLIASRTEDFTALVEKGLDFEVFREDEFNVNMYARVKGLSVFVHLEDLPTTDVRERFRQAFLDKDAEGVKSLFDEIMNVEDRFEDYCSDCFIIFDPAVK